MAGEELLDKAIALLRTYVNRSSLQTPTMTEARLIMDDAEAIIAAYDAHRQRAGEDDRVEQICDELVLRSATERVAYMEGVREGRLQALREDPATVRVPREPTEDDAMRLVGALETLRDHDHHVGVTMLRALKIAFPSGFAEGNLHAEIERNAARYQFLRSQPCYEPYGTPRIAVARSAHDGDYVNDEDADEAVDKAMLSTAEAER